MKGKCEKNILSSHRTGKASITRPQQEPEKIQLHHNARARASAPIAYQKSTTEQQQKLRFDFMYNRYGAWWIGYVNKLYGAGI